MKKQLRLETTFNQELSKNTINESAFEKSETVLCESQGRLETSFVNKMLTNELHQRPSTADSNSSVLDKSKNWLVQNVVKRKAYQEPKAAPRSSVSERRKTSLVKNNFTKKTNQKSSAVAPVSPVFSIPLGNAASQVEKEIRCENRVPIPLSSTLNTFENNLDCPPQERKAHHEDNVEASVIYQNERKNLKMMGEKSIYRYIFTFALIIGLPVYPVFIHSRRVTCFLKAWCFAVFCLRSILLLFGGIYNHMFWPSMASRYSFSLYCLIGYAILLDIFVKRRKIASSVHKLINIASNLFPCVTEINAMTKIYISICFLLSTIFFCFGINFFFHIFYVRFCKSIATFAPFSEHSPMFFYYSWIVLFAELVSYHVATATLFLTTALCGFSYLISGVLLKSYGQRLLRDLRVGLITDSTISRNLVGFNDIIRCIQEMDKAFNVSAFLTYAAVIDEAYAAVSVLLAAPENYQTTEVDLLGFFISLCTALKLFFLTLCGEYVVYQSEAIRKDLIGMSDIVLNHSNRIIHMFSILSINIRTAKIHATGLNYFRITRKIIPSVIGMIITYGHLIYQMGALADMWSSQSK